MNSKMIMKCIRSACSSSLKMDTVLAALIEIEQALNKADPKPIVPSPGKITCPICGGKVVINGAYCFNCGQRLDWS